MYIFASHALTADARIAAFSPPHASVAHTPARRRMGNHSALLQQQPRRRFDWQQQQGAAEFQPPVPLESSSLRNGEDNQPDRDGHPRIS